ncbi:MAG: GNAT family N-acetyltransferase [Bacilli bacterium]|nr:GNAT family N-acetyltransferase [Bacilli bacterium]
MIIRRAEPKDVDQILKLLSQISALHADIRPDLFISGSPKYRREEIERKLEKESELIFVVVEGEKLLAYSFCQIQTPEFPNISKNRKTFFLDDFCVDGKHRKQHIGQTLFDFLKNQAKLLGCDDILLHCWAGNEEARRFYEKAGFKTRALTMEFLLECKEGKTC